MKKLWRIKIGKFYLLKGDLNDLERIELTANNERAFLFGSERLADCYAARIGGITEPVPFISKKFVPSPVTNPEAWEHIRNEFVIEPDRANLN